MLGYGFMGKAHSNAYKTLSYMTWPSPPLMPQLVAIAGRNEEAVAGAARRYGFKEHVTDWRRLVQDDRIGVFDNSGPNNFHAEPTIAAAEAGKHVLCEKPLGRDADEAFETWQKVAATGVKAMCAFNYRFVPAIRLAKEMIAAGDLGEIFHFRGRYWSGSSMPTSDWSRSTRSRVVLGDRMSSIAVPGEISAKRFKADVRRRSASGGQGDVDHVVEGLSVARLRRCAVGTIQRRASALGVVVDRVAGFPRSTAPRARSRSTWSG